MENTGTKDEKDRIIFRGPRGGLYIFSKTGKKIHYVVPKKKASPRTESVRTIAKIWKKKVNDRIKPMKPVKNYDPEIFQMVSPRINVNILTNFKNKKYSEFIFPIESVRGRRVESKAVIASLPENFRDVRYLGHQTEYVRNLKLYDLMTVMSYTNYSHFWLGPYQRHGVVFSNFPDIAKNMIFPMFPQYDTIALAGYNTLKSSAPADIVDTASGYRAIGNSGRYLIYMYLANENMISKDTYSLMLQMYVNDLQRIILAAPKTNQTLIVYRGTSHDIYKKYKKTFSSGQFTSTAYLPGHALKYARGENGVLTRITIPPGKSSLFISPVNRFSDYGEYEIVLPISEYEITGRNKLTQIYDDGAKKFVKARVTDLKML